MELKIKERIAAEKKARFPTERDCGEYVVRDADIPMEELGRLAALHSEEKRIKNEVSILQNKFTKSLRDSGYFGMYEAFATCFGEVTVSSILEGIAYSARNSKKFKAMSNSPSIEELNKLLEELSFRMALATSPTQLREFSDSILKQLETL